MSSAGFVFPASEFHLWDGRAVGELVQACVDSSCWVRMRLSPSALQLAVRASQQTSATPLRCLLLGTAFVAKNGGVVVEVDRYDVGRCIGSSFVPTTLVPGDVVVYCTVGPEKASLCGSLAHTHLLRTLESSVDSLHPTHLLYFHVHISTDTAYCSSSPSLSLSCQCVYPDACTLTPVRDLEIVSTALARNLAGPLALPVLQDTIKWGYLTIEATRKLVLLLNTDPKSWCIPLVGVWVSGVNVHSHPVVWASVLHYKHCTKLGKRIGGAGLCLVYSSFCSHPCLFEFQIEDALDKFTHSTAHGDIQLFSDSSPLSLELIPCNYPKMAAKFSSECMTNSSASDTVNLQRNGVPLPSPQPVLARDSQLSCVSLMEGDMSGHRDLSLSTHQPLDLSRTELPPAIVNCQTTELLSHPRRFIETGTNTGMSLLMQQVPGEVSFAPQEVTISASAPGDVSVATNAPVDVSIKTETSTQPSGSINLDLHSFTTSTTLPGRSTSDGGEDCSIVKCSLEESCLFNCNKQQFYQTMMDQVQEMLQKTSECSHCTQSLSSDYARTNTELSAVPVPHIISSGPSYMESTLDEATQAADMISMKYIENAKETTSDSIQIVEVVPSQISIATDSYLRRHRLLPEQCTGQVLDVERLRTLPKLI